MPESEIVGFLIVSLFALGLSVVANGLTKTVLTAPMLCIGFGLAMASTGVMSGEGAREALHLVAEIALIVLLFLDAAQTNLSALRQRHVWPVRMLVVGLPLCILFGALAALLFLPGWPVFAVALVAAILTPTDAALGLSVVTNPDIPERPRRALTVESGLNDGIALPAVLLFASLAAEATERADVNWIAFITRQLTLGPLTGIVIGCAGGFLLLWAKRQRLATDPYEGIGTLSLAMTSYFAASLIGGNGFIAAFIAGLCFGNIVKSASAFIYEFTESEGQLLSWAAFFLLGLALLPAALAHLDLATVAIVLVSLFVVRPVSIWISLIGTDASPETRLFFGWFGPRGLATALFALLVVPQIDAGYAEPVLYIAINAVWISALLHGLTAAPLGRLYARRIKARNLAAESEPVIHSAKPLRKSGAHRRNRKNSETVAARRKF
ncbi:cation:proton antiporter [Hoeflea sp. CAU 1731]